MPGGRPAKTLSLVQGHRTNAEKALRKKGEESVFTGMKIQESDEVKKNKIAHKEFLRLRNLFNIIGKDDDLTGNVINTHCILHAEIADIELSKARFENDIEALIEKYAGGEIEFKDYQILKNNLYSSLSSADKKIMDKRSMILNIAKENIMTIQSALRSIPKKEEKQEKSKMQQALEKRAK